MSALIRIVSLSAIVAAGLAISGPAWAHGKEQHPAPAGGETMLEQMREMHKGHDHAHDFGVMEAMSPEQMTRVMGAMHDIGLAMPPMNAHHGRELFVEKGCVVCHSINGVGGDVGPSLNAHDMPVPMNAFEFAARMWRGASAMIQMQEEVFGEQVSLTGQDIADLVAFAHDAHEQAGLSAKDIPDQFRALIEH